MFICVVLITVAIQCAPIVFGVTNLTVSTSTDESERYIGDCCSAPEYTGISGCSKNSVYLLYVHCITWNNATSQLEIGRCMLIHQHNSDSLCYNYVNKSYLIPRNLSVFKVNEYTCRPYNRQGAKCGQCIEGYGPAVFSDAVTCAECSSTNHLWVVMVLFQLTMVTLMYVAVVLFRIQGTASPLNFIITYSQLCVNAIKFGSGFYVTLMCSTNKKVVVALLTLLGVWNLDFFRLLLPYKCISTFTRFSNVLLLDYVIAIYPLLITVFIFVMIELHDRNCRIVVFLSLPLKKIIRRNWNPKETVLNTCITFLLLSYSKLLFVSISLLIAVPSYNCNGKTTLNSPLLLFDPSIRYFHSEHIPYAVLSMSIIVLFIILPPILLCFYPTKMFRNCLRCMGFKRWDILHLIMDIFQGWFKDGTENSLDYRCFSSLYMLLRLALAFAIIPSLFDTYHHVWVISALLHVGVGVMYFIIQPYRRKWMNYTDGLFFYSLGIFQTMRELDQRLVFIVAFVLGSLVIVSFSFYALYKFVRRLLI